MAERPSLRRRTRLADASRPQPTKVRGATLLACAVVVGLTAACGSSDEPPAAAPDDAVSTSSTTSSEPSTSSSAPSPSAAPSESSSSTPAEEIVITITDFVYEVPESVPAGATVTVVNEDAAAHTVTSSEDGAFDVNIPGGESATFTAPQEPGSYDFVCIFHGNMQDTLVVA